MVPEPPDKRKPGKPDPRVWLAMFAAILNLLRLILDVFRP